MEDQNPKRQTTNQVDLTGDLNLKGTGDKPGKSFRIHKGSGSQEADGRPGRSLDLIGDLCHGVDMLG